MGLEKRTLVVVALGCLLQSARAQAQTNDRFFRSWSWAVEEPTARSAGLGGATVALADDASAALVNPAGILTLPKSELAISLRRAATSKAGAGDPLAARSALGFAGGAGLLGRKWGVGGFVSQPQALDLRLAGAALPDGSVDGGYLKSRITEVGGALAWNPRGRLYLGLRLSATHLELEGSHTQEDVEGATTLQVGTASGSTRVTGSLGVLCGLNENLRLGLLVSPGASWRAERTAVNPLIGAVLDPGSEYEVRSPGVVSLGASLRVSDRVKASGQLDYVRYSEIRSTLVIRRGAFVREDYDLADAFEPRLGVEASFSLGEVSLQARAGLHGQASGALAYRQGDTAEAAAFAGGERAWRVAAGGSIVTRSLGVDAAVSFGAGASRLLAGASVRF